MAEVRVIARSVARKGQGKPSEKAPTGHVNS